MSAGFTTKPFDEVLAAFIADIVEPSKDPARVAFVRPLTNRAGERIEGVKRILGNVKTRPDAKHFVSYYMSVVNGKQCLHRVAYIGVTSGQQRGTNIVQWQYSFRAEVPEGWTMPNVLTSEPQASAVMVDGGQAPLVASAASTPVVVPVTALHSYAPEPEYDPLEDFGNEPRETVVERSEALEITFEESEAMGRNQKVSNKELVANALRMDVRELNRFLSSGSSMISLLIDRIHQLEA